MKQGLKTALVILVTVFVTSLFWLLSENSTRQSKDKIAAKVSSGGEIPPDLNGIWQAASAAHWDIEPHNARSGEVLEMGALGAIPAGLGIVESGEIPYHPEALAQRNENRAHWLERDPLVKCYMPGIPRANYLPFPFQIIQSDDHMVFAYEFASASRVVSMNPDNYTEALNESWMGHSLGRWEDGSLIIEVSDQVADTWFDSAGNFHSEQLSVVERFTPAGPNLLWYEAELTDPAVFTRPWTIRLPLYRRMEPDMQLLEFKCVEFVEEMMHGHLVKKEEAAE